MYMSRRAEGMREEKQVWEEGRIRLVDRVE